MLAYLWNIFFDETLYKDSWHEIYKMPIIKEKLKGYITEHHDIKSGRDFLWDRSEKEDLILMYRKK